MISGLVFLAGFGPYILSIFRGKTKPSRFSWAVWAVLDLMMSYGQYLKGELAFQAIGAGCGSWFVFFLSIWKGKKGWEWADVVCTVCGLTGIGLWKTLDNPTWGIGMAALGSIVAAVPTFKEAIKAPEEENRLAWTTWTISCVFQLAAIRKWDLDSVLQPFAFTFTEVTMMFLLFVRPWWQRRKTSLS